MLKFPINKILCYFKNANLSKGMVYNASVRISPIPTSSLLGKNCHLKDLNKPSILNLNHTTIGLSGENVTLACLAL